jgi:hypothetical protein
MRRAWKVARIEERSGAYRVLVEQIEGKRSLVRPRCRRKLNMKMDLKK